MSFFSPSTLRIHQSSTRKALRSPLGKSPSLLVSGVATLAAAGTLLYAEPSKADTLIGVQGNLNTLTQPSRDGTGVGIDFLLGKRLDLTLVTLGTELLFGVHSFAGADEAKAYRALAGANLGVGSILRPSVFAHIGVGHIAVAEDAFPDQSRTALAGDVGVALDFTLLPVLDIGVQGSYNAIRGTSSTDPFRWFQGGVHATLVF
jgi:hypothetical protein